MEGNKKEANKKEHCLSASRVFDSALDMMGGSVYQKFYPYMSEKVHVICGMNLPMALSLVLAPEDERLTSEKVEQVLMDCKNQLVYVNKMAVSVDEDDE